MPRLVESLINLRNALGYPKEEDGACSLYSNMAINAFLVGELNVFYQRCAYIKQQIETPTFLDLIKKVRATSYSAVIKSVSAEELEVLPALLDVMAFIESGELYQNPHSYRPVFDKRLAQKKDISVFVQSKVLEQRKGRVLAKSFIGIYTLEELKDYIKLLNQLAENAQQDFALNLGSDDHDIGLCYSHATKSWQLFDVNRPGLQPFSTEIFNWEEQLASKIKTVFEDTTHIAFQTEIWTTGLSAPSLQKHIRTFSDDSKFKELHDIASHIALTNARDASLVSLAARAGDMETLGLCVEAKAQNGSYKVDLNKPQADGVTPLLIASYQGHVDALKLLIEAKDEKGNYRVDLNKPLPTGQTAVYLAAQNGSVDALKLLIEAKNPDGTPRADLNKASVHGLSPVFMAVRQGQKEVIVELLKQNVDINLLFAYSVEELKEFAQNFNSDVVQRVNEFTQNKAADDEIHIDLKDLAWIRGHDEIVSLFEQKKLAEKMQEAIKASEETASPPAAIERPVDMDTTEEEQGPGSPPRTRKRKFEEVDGKRFFPPDKRPRTAKDDEACPADSKRLSVVLAMRFSSD